MACIAEYSHTFPHGRDGGDDDGGLPRKRRRLTSSWDVVPCGYKVQQCPGFAGNGNGEGASPCPLLSDSSLDRTHAVSLSFSSSSSSNSPNLGGAEGDYWQSRCESPPWRNDDKEGHYVFAVGDNLTPRYKIISKMGQGTFGQVLECWDRNSKDLVAIKVTRGLEKYREDAQIEIDVLNEVAKYDKTGKRYVACICGTGLTIGITLVSASSVHGICIDPEFVLKNIVLDECDCCIQVFEKLGPSLYDCLKKNDFRPFPVNLVRQIGKQLLESVAYMHLLKLVHTDLKPENILFVSSDFDEVPDFKNGRKRSSQEYLKLPRSSAIKLIDFGSTVFEDQDHTSVISTRHYRAPEVIMGLGWNYPSDVWSVGCILAELCSGETLFQTQENLEHLAMMERVLGPLPRHMIKRANRRCNKYFRHGTRLDWPEGASSSNSIRAVRKLLKLGNLVKQHVGHSTGLLIDLLHGLLKFDPSERMTARDALRHPFFKEI